MSDLIIEGLVKNFGKVRAVDSVSLTVKSGTLTTLLGPSGCGKTTTLNSIAGLDPIDEGIIRVGDFVLNDSKRGIALQPEERELGMVFQSYALWPHMKVYDNLAFGLKLKKVSDAETKRRIKETLELVSLVEMEQRYPFQLSGGQQQRVALARAVVAQPRLLLLDEPLSNLDAKVREQARFWLRDFQRRLGITTVYVTHDQAEALAISDMVAVMSNGALLQYAPPHEIYDKPSSKFVADFIGVSSFLSGMIVERTGQLTCIKIASGEVLTSTRPAPAGDRVSIAIRSERIRLLDASDRSPNSIPARITSSVYLGSKYQYLVEIQSGTMRVETMDAAPGEQIRLAFAPEDLILLPDEK
ncbi:MAG TPA: ABC transporter ATP-binding protein [Anaerolineae bacterium]